MIYDTFQSLKVGNRLKPSGKVRSYPVVSVERKASGRVVFVCLNPTAVEKKRETALKYGIFAADSLDHPTHYLNWDKVS